MTEKQASLAREVQLALSGRLLPARPEGWAVADRRRFLPFVSLSGAAVGVAIGLFLALGEADEAVVELLLLLGLGAGIAAGVAVGWVLYAAAAGITEAAAAARGLRWLRGVFAVLAYFGAALAAAFAFAIVGGAGLKAVESLGSVLTVIAVLGIVLVPASLIFGRARPDASIRAHDIGGVIRETLDAASPSEDAASRRRRTAIVVVFVWLILGTVLLVRLLAYVEALDPAAYAVAFGTYGLVAWTGAAVAWLSIVVAGATLTIRVARLLGFR